MNSSSNSWAAARRNQSPIRRWISGSGRRGRSGRGGKSPALDPTPAHPPPLPPLLPDQEGGCQHHGHSVAVEAGPQPPLVLIPAQQAFGLLVVLLHPVAPVRVAHHRLQPRPRAQVAPVVLAVRRRI